MSVTWLKRSAKRHLQSVENFERIMNGEDAAVLRLEKNNKNTVHQNVKRIKDKMIVEINRLRYELEKCFSE